MWVLSVNAIISPLIMGPLDQEVAPNQYKYNFVKASFWLLSGRLKKETLFWLINRKTILKMFVFTF